MFTSSISKATRDWSARYQKVTACTSATMPYTMEAAQMVNSGKTSLRTWLQKPGGKTMVTTKSGLRGRIMRALWCLCAREGGWTSAAWSVLCMKQLALFIRTGMVTQKKSAVGQCDSECQKTDGGMEEFLWGSLEEHTDGGKKNLIRKNWRQTFTHT